MYRFLSALSRGSWCSVEWTGFFQKRAQKAVDWEVSLFLKWCLSKETYWVFSEVLYRLYKTNSLQNSVIKTSTKSRKGKHQLFFFLPSLSPLNQWQVTSLLALTETVFHDLGIVLINVALICWRCRSSLACILHTAVLHFWNEVVRG